MKYKYYDGSGNVYKINGLKLSYTPITKEQSSSGNYDGGIPYTKELTKGDLLKLVSAFETAIWDVSDHISKREMGSGMLVKEVDGSLQAKVILRRRSTTNVGLLEMLESL